MQEKLVDAVVSYSQRRRAVLPVAFLVAVLGATLTLPVGAQVATALPMEISPEGVQKLAASNLPFVLVDADERDAPSGAPDLPIRRIYYTLGPWSRSAQNKVFHDRKSMPLASPEPDKFASQRLVGTPLEWQSVGLKFDRSPQPSRPLLISPKQLGEAIKDGVDLQIVDLRPLHTGSATSLAPGARRVMPHQLDNDPGMLTKQRWIVLVDDGGRVASPLADRLFARGYVLVAVLDGGYPAWVEATDR